MNILFASPVDSEAIDKIAIQHHPVCAFDAPTEVLQDKIVDCQVLVFRSGVKITAEVMRCAPELRLIIRAGSGLDNLDVDYVRQHGLELVRIPEPGAQAVAEMSICFMLALSRNLLEADRLTRQGHWAKHELIGFLLAGKKLGIVGAGNIGSCVGQMGAALGMDVIGCVEHPSLFRAAELSAKNIRLTRFDEVISTADYISIHVPLKDSTRNLINADVLQQVKPGAFLINLARGGVVDERALYQLMTGSGRLRGAALDVHENEVEGKISPLAELPNVILTPHIGAMTYDSQRQIGQRIIETISSFDANCH